MKTKYFFPPFIRRWPFAEHGVHGWEGDTLAQSFQHPYRREYAHAGVRGQRRQQSKHGGNQYT